MSSRDAHESREAGTGASAAQTEHDLPGRAESERRVTQEVDRAQRYRHPLSVATMELDPLPPAMAPRNVEPGGMFAHFVRRVRAVQRDCDVLSHWSADVVLWILPETELDAAVLACERLRRALAGAAPGNSPPLTISVGVAELEPGEEGASLLKRAHDAFLISQARGRNCVTRADVLPRPDSAA